MTRAGTMTPAVTMIGLAVLGLAGFAPSIASAGGTFTVDARAAVFDQSVTHQLAEDHVVILSSGRQVVVSDAPDSPLLNASGPCFGKIEIQAGAVSGDGYCTWVDADGEAHVLSWAATGMTEDGGLLGSWAVVGGEGKWAGATGGGDWRFQSTGRPDHSINTATGEIVLK